MVWGLPSRNASGRIHSMRSPPPVRPCSGYPSSDHTMPSLLPSQWSSRSSLSFSSDGTVRTTLNQWVDQAGPNHSPTRASLKSYLPASSNVGLSSLGASHTDSLTAGLPEATLSFIILDFRAGSAGAREKGWEGRGIQGSSYD